MSRSLCIGELCNRTQFVQAKLVIGGKEFIWLVILARLIAASKVRHNGSWVSNQARAAGSRDLIPWGPEGAPNRGHALLMWCTVCRLPHGHHSESVAPILAKNEAVFAQTDLRRFRRTKALRGRSWPGCLLDGHSINSSKVLLLAAYSLDD